MVPAPGVRIVSNLSELKSIPINIPPPNENARSKAGPEKKSLDAFLHNSELALSEAEGSPCWGAK